ncbi:uncharacterized protein TNCV_2103961 [Trichonephila clavipes]|nr:uncharacterized protein TNCV_2103961 [Trichonephila clavipes]
MDEILTTARDLEEELILGHEDELTIEELQEILNEEHQETHRNASPFEQEEDEREPMPTSAIKDLLKNTSDKIGRRSSHEKYLSGQTDHTVLEKEEDQDSGGSIAW